MENTDNKFQWVRVPEFYDRVDKILADPATTDEEREARNSKLLERVNDPSTTDDELDSIRSFIVNEGLNRLLAEEG